MFGSSQFKSIYIFLLLVMLSSGVLLTPFNRVLDAQADEPPELIVNGDFANGLDGWEGRNDNASPPIVDPETQSLYLENTTVFQPLITVPDHEIYEFSFNCIGDGVEPNLIFNLYDLVADVGLPIIEKTCDANSQFAFTLSLVPGDYEVLYIGKDVYLDNVSLKAASNYEDIDTGLITNGDFIGSTGWENLENDGSFPLIAYDGATTNGALIDAGKQSDIVIPTPGKYMFSFACQDESVEPTEGAFFFSTNDELALSESFSCSQQEMVFELVFLSTAAPFELIILAPSSRDQTSWIDDIKLVLTEEIIPDPTETPTSTIAISPTITSTATVAPTNTLLPTATETQVSSPTVPATATAELTQTATATATATSVPAATQLPSSTPTMTATSAPTSTVIPSETPSSTTGELQIFLPIVQADN